MQMCSLHALHVGFAHLLDYLACIILINNDDRTNTKRYTDDGAIVNVEYKEKGALSKLVYQFVIFDCH